MKPQMLIRFIVSVLVLVILFSFMIGFQVRQNEQVVLTRFGSPTRVIQKPGAVREMAVAN
jgi:regulator of protease activity HflC (stomatin/prohibitin superfamily)